MWRTTSSGSDAMRSSDPARARELAKRPRKNGVNMKPEANPPDIPPLQTAAQIRDFLAQVMTDLRRRVIDSKTASVLASLATAQLRAASAAELETRVENLEKKVGGTGPSDATPGLLSQQYWETLFAPGGAWSATASERPTKEQSETSQASRRAHRMPQKAHCFGNMPPPPFSQANQNSAFQSSPRCRHFVATCVSVEFPRLRIQFGEKPASVLMFR